MEKIQANFVQCFQAWRRFFCIIFKVGTSQIETLESQKHRVSYVCFFVYAFCFEGPHLDILPRTRLSLSLWLEVHQKAQDLSSLFQNAKLADIFLINDQVDLK